MGRAFTSCSRSARDDLHCGHKDFATSNEEVVELKRWFPARIDWLDSKVLNHPRFVP
jgi:hypothetical protein